MKFFIGKKNHYVTNKTIPIHFNLQMNYVHHACCLTTPLLPFSS